jgi:multidrug resistance protein MdtO
MGKVWIERVWQDLQPTPGRVNATLRITLASILTLLILLTLQMPFASLGLYFVFLVNRDAPAVSIRASILSLLTLGFAVALELSLVIVTDNDPMARVLGVAGVSFLAGVLMLSSNLSPLASICGFIFCTLIGTWETHASADALVKGSLWLVATAGVALGCSVAVEYCFSESNPARKLVEQIHTRYEALETMFALYTRGADVEAITAASLRVSRLAIAGQAGMQELYNKIVARNLDIGNLPVGSRIRITMLAELMDVSAAFASHNLAVLNEDSRLSCAQIAERCGKLKVSFTPHSGLLPLVDRDPSKNLLAAVEATLNNILSMPEGDLDAREKGMVALPTSKVPFLIPSVFQTRDAVAFALKISLCCTICYITYLAIDWPGISTSVTTVLITGLSSSGAIKQKLIFRLLGSAIGGFLALAATAFLFPQMDSITSLVVLVAIIAFGSAWCTTGRRFNYVGLQIAFSFYLVAFEGFSSPTQLAPARDRLIGILLALVVMAFVFDQLWPVRTVTTMRRALASILRGEATLLRLLEGCKPGHDVFQKADALRDYIGKTIASLRTMSEAVDFEFGVNREDHAHSAAMIISAALHAGAIFWNQLAFLHQKESADYFEESRLVDLRRQLAAQIDCIADSVVRKGPAPTAPFADLVPRALLEDPRYGEYSRNSLARYEELQAIAGRLSHQA